MRLAMKKATISNKIAFKVKFKNPNDQERLAPPFCWCLNFESTIKCIFYYYLVLVVFTIPFNLYLRRYFEESSYTFPLPMSKQAMFGIVLVLAKACSIGCNMSKPYGLRKKNTRESMFQAFFITTVLEIGIFLISLFLSLNVFIDGEQVRFEGRNVSGEGNSKNIRFAVFYSMRPVIDIIFTIVLYKFYKWDDRMRPNFKTLEEDMEL